MAVYWLGQNGQVYLKGNDGVVKNMGTAWNGDASYLKDVGADTTQGSFEATRIADPLAPTPSAPVGGAAKPALNTGAVANTQGSIDQIPALLQAALASEATSHANTVGGFDSAEKTQNETYGKSTDTNQQNYDSNYMSSILAGIKGLGGVINMLRGSGAAGGTAEDMARDAVGGTTANDIRGGADTRDQNQTALDSSLAGFMTDLKGKRQAAEDTFTNNNRAINRDSNTQLQDLYSKMAGYYGDAGNTATANDFMGRAGALTPAIAANSKTQTSAYDTTPVAVQAPQLTAFATPSQPDVASIPQDGQVGSGIFTMTKRKDTSAIPLAAPAGA